MIYQRHCLKCDELFEVHCKIVEKQIIEPHCPFCDSINGEWMLTAPMLISDSSRLSRGSDSTQAKEFQQGVLNKIAKTYPLSDLAKR